MRKAPEIFILTFIMRRACSARLLVQVVGEGDGEVDEEAQDVVFELVQSDEQVVSGAVFCPAAVRGMPLKARQVAMKGEALPEDLPVAGDEAFEHGRGQTGRGRLARLLDRPIGLE